MANQHSGQNTGSESNQDSAGRHQDADDKPNNGSKLHRARDTHSDDAPAQNRASDKLENEARQLTKASRQGSGPITGGIQQDVDDGQLQSDGDGEQDSEDAQDQQADGRQNGQGDDKLKGKKTGTSQASNGDAKKPAQKSREKSGASASSKQDRSSNSGKKSGSASKGKDGGNRQGQAAGGKR